MQDIKTRDAVKSTIKTIDKSAVAAQRMKDAFVRTKEKAQNSTTPTENSPEECAADRVTDKTETVVYAVAGALDRSGRKAVKNTGENIERAKAYLEQRKAAQPRETAKKGAEKAQETARAIQQPTASPHTAPVPITPSAETPQPSPAGARIKILDRQRMTIRTRQRSRTLIRQPEHTGRRRSVKGTFWTVKTAEQSAQAAIKTGEQAARTAQASAGATVKTAEKTVQAARATAKTAADAAKRASDTARKTIRAIIAATKALIEAILAGGWAAVTIILIVVLLGAALSLFGGGSGHSGYEPVSAEVEAYTPIIRLYAQKYGVSEYVELIKAVIMQESGGQGTDPMQCSESGYNTEYPREPGGITDPEYSIQVGVQALAGVLSMARVESPVDLDGISLALQGYNYGPGYIFWALNNYGGYSELNAIEYSDMMAEQYGWSGYGDKAYVSHVLRYYPIGRSFMAEGNTAIVAVAQTQIGNEGGLKYCEWYGYPYRVEWCAIFVSWCADQCGCLDAGVLPKELNVIPYVEWFREREQWQGQDYEPIPGDLIFFDWEPDGRPDHVGIVEKIEDRMIYTVEGNSNDACKENRYYSGDVSIYGYGLPAY